MSLAADHPGVSESPFRFGLERVREVRVHDERTAQEVLASSLNARLREEAALAAARAGLEEARRRAVVPAHPAAPLTGAALIAGQAWIQRLERRTEQAVRQTAVAEAQVGRDRESVLEASRRREALDKLKARRRAEHNLAAGRAECARLDEMAMRMTRPAA